MRINAALAKLRKGGAEAGLPLVGLIVFQLLCTIFFIVDVVSDVELSGIGSVKTLAFLPEISATVGLLVGIAFELRVLWQMRQRHADMAKGLKVAAGALDQLMNSYFDDWSLTPSERDVAGFTIKGYSIAEIAELRGSAEGTVKTHLNAIYRKANVAGRAQLVSLLVEDLFRAPLPTEKAPLLVQAAE